MRMIESLWEMGIWPDALFRCPICNSKVEKVGVRDMSIQHYKCVNSKCNWDDVK
jgi:hypothetical protein